MYTLMNSCPANSNAHVWINGQYVDFKDATVHVLSNGLNYATTVFEGIRSYNGTVFKLQQHLERLSHSASMLGFKIPYNYEHLSEIVADIITRNKLLKTTAYIRIIAWFGNDNLSSNDIECVENIAIAAWQMPINLTADGLDKSVKVVEGRFKRPSSDFMPVSIKSSNLYTTCAIMKREAIEFGYDDAIMLDGRCFVAELTASNLFFVKKDELHTPTTYCCLNGITRQTVIELGKNMGYKIEEKDISLNDLGQYNDVFSTSTANGIARIATIRLINGVEYSHFAKSDVLSNIAIAYNDLVYKV